ncbi:MAG: hypothetical protein HY331_15735 [Chloroflexi bacterium]|nr:hypothetical protein [Chloroflexota bacterium]
MDPERSEVSPSRPGCIIQVDCDGVLCHGLFGLQSWAIRARLGFLAAPLHPLRRRLRPAHRSADKSIDRFVPSRFYRYRSACAGSAEGLRRLRTAGYRLVLVTGRSARFQGGTTEEWLRRQGIRDVFDDVICCPDGLRSVEHKLGQAHRLRPVAAIEDDPATAVALAAVCPVWLIRTPLLGANPALPDIAVFPSLQAAAMAFLGL